MKKAISAAGIVVLIALGMGLTSMSEVSAKKQATGVILKGTLQTTGGCARLLTCDGLEVVGLLSLPSSYAVGDQVELKGQVVTTPTFCTQTNRIVTIGRIRLAPC